MWHQHESAGFQRSRRTVAAAATALVLAGCSDLLAIRPDPQTVNPRLNPPLLNETMNGVQADFNFSYDIWLIGAGMFGNEVNSVSFLRWEMANRIPSEAPGVSSGTGAASPNDRSQRANFPAFYSYLQTVLATSANAQARVLAGDFPSIANPPNSSQIARLAVIRGFALIWLADVWCDFVLDGQPTIYTSVQGWNLARVEFEQALSSTGASAEDINAARAGLARVYRLLGNWPQADAFAALVPPSFTYQTTYGALPQANQNRVWFHLWAFGEHTVSARWRNLTLDGTATPDSRVSIVAPPISPSGTLDVLRAPNKVPAVTSSLNVTSGAEALLIRAEAALAAGQLQSAVDRINAVRTLRGVALAWAPQALDATVIRDKLIDERGRTLLLEGTRVGDLRFYLRTYRLDLWHTSIPQAAAMGTATCHPVPLSSLFHRSKLIRIPKDR